MVAQNNMTTQPRDAFRVRDMQRAKLEALCLAETEEPAVVERVEVRRVWPRVRRAVQRLWPRMDVAMLRLHPQTRTHLIDVNGNGVADLHLVTVLVFVGEVAEPVVTGMRRLPDPSIPADVEVIDLATADVIEIAKLAHIKGA